MAGPVCRYDCISFLVWFDVQYSWFCLLEISDEDPLQLLFCFMIVWGLPNLLLLWTSIVNIDSIWFLVLWVLESWHHGAGLMRVLPLPPGVQWWIRKRLFSLVRSVFQFQCIQWVKTCDTISTYSHWDKLGKNTLGDLLMANSHSHRKRMLKLKFI